jgi:hypothetical protein
MQPIIPQTNFSADVVYTDGHRNLSRLNKPINAMAKTPKKAAKKSAKKTSRPAAKTSAKKTAKKTGSKPGPKDREYVNKKQKYEVAYEPKRKTPAKKFGSKAK